VGYKERKAFRVAKSKVKALSLRLPQPNKNTFFECRFFDRHFFYRRLSICSLIFSSSSFIFTTNFCIGASFDLDPMVLISRPISWEIKFIFFPMIFRFPVFHEIIDVTIQPNNFLIDIQFFDVVDQLLLKSVYIHFFLGQ
jgi:hypothetical protein